MNAKDLDAVLERLDALEKNVEEALKHLDTVLEHLKQTLAKRIAETITSTYTCPKCGQKGYPSAFEEDCCTRCSNRLRFRN